MPKKESPRDRKIYSTLVNVMTAELGSVILDLGAGVSSLTDDDIYYRRLQPSDVEQCKVSSGEYRIRVVFS